MAHEDDLVGGPQLRSAAAKGSAAAAGALIGVVGGPAGVVAGAAAGASLPEVLAAVRLWIYDRQRRILEPTLAAVGGDDELAAAIGRRPDLVPLILRSSDAAARSSWDTHIDALAGALRDGVTGLRTAQATERILEALIPMTPDAAVVLDYMAHNEPPGEGGEDGAGHFDERTLAHNLGIGLSRVRVALRHLEEGAAVETIGGLYDGGEGWKPTDLAPDVLRYLSER